MRTATKVSLYVGALIALFAAALGLGSVVGPVGPASDRDLPPTQTETRQGGMDMDAGH